jgi:hypothetical protein
MALSAPPIYNIGVLCTILPASQAPLLLCDDIDCFTPVCFACQAIKNGVCYGTRKGLFIYPLADVKELKTKHYPCWRSAGM